MSAYIVDKHHIDLLVRAALGYSTPNARCRWWVTDDAGNYTGWHKLAVDAEHNPQEGHVSPHYLGQILVNENVASVTARYPNDDADRGELPGPINAYYLGPYIYTDPGHTLTPGQVFAAIDSLDYQSCEHAEWMSSEAYAFLRSLRQMVGRALPDYDTAWKKPTHA